MGPLAMAVLHAAGPESRGAVRHGSVVRRVARFLTDDKPTSSPARPIGCSPRCWSLVLWRRAPWVRGQARCALPHGRQAHVLTGTTNWLLATLLVPSPVAPCAMGPRSGALRTSRGSKPTSSVSPSVTSRHVGGPGPIGAARRSAQRRIWRPRPHRRGRCRCTRLLGPGLAAPRAT